MVFDRYVNKKHRESFCEGISLGRHLAGVDVELKARKINVWLIV